ncbi:MAG TPA: O-antigen ligase family protein [Phycisphaerae bacterium]|nr:O-antigen ligase family protein [Phycisphaerae bacterium]
MPAKTVLFLLGFAACAVGALFMPSLGVLGYVGHYCIGPERQWWSAPIAYWGIRYSYVLAVVTAVGIFLNRRKLRYGDSILHRQELAILLFLGIVWACTLFSEPTTGAYTEVDHPSVKMTKVVIWTLMLTHLFTTLKDLNRLMWVLVVGCLILGYQAYTAPAFQFTRGRLQSVGGADFNEANFLAAFLASMLPLVGVQFLQARWSGKMLCLASGVLSVNAIVLTRSRGALVALGLGAVAALVLSPRRWRGVIILGLIVAMVGAYSLTDPAYFERASTISANEQELDRSSQSRIGIWRASVRMLRDHPFGVGTGNFFQAIGRYDPQFEGRDAHNTFVRCYGELGIPGLAVFAAIVGNALYMLIRTVKRAMAMAPELQGQAVYTSYAVAVSLVILVGCSLTMSLIYVEVLWWLLALPVCLVRIQDNSARSETAALFLSEDGRVAKTPARSAFRRSTKEAPNAAR